MAEPASPSKMETNAAIEDLIADPTNPDWKQKAGAILVYAQRIKRDKGHTWTFINRSPSDGGSFMGHAAGAGDVRVQDKKPGEPRVVEFNAPKERVGHYKMWRSKIPRVGRALHFQYFWKSDAETASETEEPREYVIALDSRGGPKEFGWLGAERWFGFSIPLLSVVVTWSYYYPFDPTRNKRRIGYGYKIIIGS